MARISVLVPVYNVEKYLVECLDSLCRQTLEDIEIICVDDGSTDGCGAILDEYASKDERFKVIHKKNTGYGNSMNVALDAANGDYIAIVESDDFAETDMLEKLLQAAVSTGADIVKGEYFRYCGGKNEYAGRLQKYPHDVAFSVSDQTDMLELADTIWSCLYKRDFLQKNNIRFHETPGASFQDISFALQGWLRSQTVCFIDDAVLHYRMDNTSSSMHNPDKIFCVFDEYQWLEDLFVEFWPNHPVLEQGFVATKYRDYFNHYYRVAEPYQYALLLRITEAFTEDRKEGRVQRSAFRADVWQNLMRMSENLNAFFKTSAKNLEDPRLSFCRFKNDAVYKRAFVEELKSYEHVLLYGAGKIGSRMCESLQAQGVTVECFVVTEPDGQQEHMDIPVRSLADVACFKDSGALVIAVAQRLQYDLYTNAEKYGFKHVFRADSIIKEL